MVPDTNQSTAAFIHYKEYTKYQTYNFWDQRLKKLVLEPSP